MSERERLIELIKQAKKQTKNANCDIERNMIFADYLIAHGVIVPPCKVGDEDNKRKIAKAVCIATQKTNDRCEHIKPLCERKGILGGCAYCNVMAEELIANGITVNVHSTEKGGVE